MIEKKITKRRPKSNIKIGDKFGRLVVKKIAGKTKQGGNKWYCICDCGKHKTVSGGNLYSGHTKSCGCLNTERIITHGMSKSPTYRIWEGIIGRCCNPKDTTYNGYGGRGITVCKEWRESFETFFNDMGERPPGLTIERIDNNLGYFKDNCKWATYTEQLRNQRLRKTNKVGFNGIHWNKERHKYHVQITINYINHYVGLFKNLEDAKAARIAAEQKYWGCRRRVYE